MMLHRLLLIGIGLLLAPLGAIMLAHAQNAARKPDPREAR